MPLFGCVIINLQIIQRTGQINQNKRGKNTLVTLFFIIIETDTVILANVIERFPDCVNVELYFPKRLECPFSNSKHFFNPANPFLLQEICNGFAEKSAVSTHFNTLWRIET